MANSSYYFDVLYPYQDRVIQVINQVETEFYLTGGTAASRAYLNHRFSDDLDFFVNDDPRFGLWVERLIQALNTRWKCDVLLKEDRFARFNLTENDQFMKIELINDVPSRIGVTQNHLTLGRVDSRKYSGQQDNRIAGPRGAKRFSGHMGFLFYQRFEGAGRYYQRAEQGHGRFPG